MHLTVRALSSLVHGRAHGPADRLIRAARTLQEAGPDDITFLENERHAKHLKTCRAAALVIPATLADKVGELIGPDGHQFAFIDVADPLGAFIAIYRQVQGESPAPAPGIAAQAVIHPTAALGPDCTVMPFATIGEGAVLGARCVIHSGAHVGANCRLGDDVVLYPNVVLYDRTILGHRVIVHGNAVLGADGFGYRFAGGKHVKVPQLGNVEIGDDVEIGSCSTVDRGTFGATRVGTGSKIDNLVIVAHNCQIGRHNLLCGQVGFAGSCSTGDYVVLAGGVGVADHVHIGDRSVIGAGSGVPNDIDADQRVIGYPVRPEAETMRMLATQRHLPEMWRDLRQLKKQMETLLAASNEQERKAG